MPMLIPENDDDLPVGYHYGAHTSWPGGSGYYIIREHDDAYCVAWLTPEDVAVPSPQMIDRAIKEEEGS